jgi:hypothetical protein
MPGSAGSGSRSPASMRPEAGDVGPQRGEMRVDAVDQVVPAFPPAGSAASRRRDAPGRRLSGRRDDGTTWLAH